MPDGEKVEIKEIVKFCVKQFFVDDPPKLKEHETLFGRTDILYLVTFKRLEGKYTVYHKAVNLFLKHEDVRPAIDFEEMGVDYKL